MNFRHPFILAAGILFLGFAAIAAYSAFNIYGLILLTLAALLFAIAVNFTFRFRAVLIDEMEVGVIFNRINNSFCRFEVSPSPQTGHNCRNYRLSRWIPFGRKLLTYNDPYFVQLRWFEKLEDTIPKRAQTAKGTLANVRTAEGVPVSIDWKISYAVDVEQITNGLEYKMARALPQYSEKIVSGRAARAIKHLIEIRTIRSLYEQGAIQSLEQEVCQRVYRQLSHPVNLGFKEITPKDVSLGPITVPSKVEQALALAHQRKIQAETVAKALERLQLAVSNISKEDMRRWAELERLRILDDKDSKLLYLSDAFVRNESIKVKRNGNGRSQSN